MTPAAFADAVRAYCARMRGSVTSWIRTPEHNALVGGALESAHLYQLGADVVYEPAPRPDEAKGKAAAARLGLTLIREGDHDHLQPATWPGPA